MKKLFLSAFLSCLAIGSSSILMADTETAAASVYDQQIAFVDGLIKHCKTRLPLVAPKQVVNKDIDTAIACLDELSSLLNTHPDALECVIDTFQICIDQRCADIPAQVNACMRNYENSEKTFSLPDTQVIQQKLSDLVTSYFNFQLTTLGAIDHYMQEFLQKNNIHTYISLAKPWLTYIAIYATLHLSLEKIKELVKVNAFNHVSGGLLKEFDNSAVKAITAGFLTPDLRTSVDSTHKYLNEIFDRTYANVVSKYRKTNYRAKPSKESFSTVKGFDDTKLLLTPLVDYCAHLTEYRAADLKIAHGYIFEGSLADGRKMSHALAGEITQKLKSRGSKCQWLMYEIHGSSLVTKNLDTVIAECLEFGPAVLIINNLDWVYTQKDVKPDVYAHIISKLTKYLAQDSNFPLIVCATTQDNSVIDPVMLEAHKLELIKLS